MVWRLLDRRECRPERVASMNAPVSLRDGKPLNWRNVTKHL
ncbi:hypothetical protein RRSWK_06346 [Rhodopirellula sp. SWK7]|nr:hypothetical protein RRSWK_06346 [Rhodopirellula sp. SWK7]